MSPERRAIVEALTAERYAPSPRPRADLLARPAPAESAGYLPPVTAEQAAANRQTLEDAIGSDPSDPYLRAIA